MLTQTTPTNSATIPVTVPGISDTTTPTIVPGIATGAGSTGVNQQAVKPQEVPTTTALVDKKISPMMLLYAISVYAYAAAFRKTSENIQTSPNGNGLFPMEEDINQPVQVTKGNQLISGVESAFTMNSTAVANAVNNATDDNNTPISAETKAKEKETGILSPDEVEEEI